jgi:hypothetical protein
MDDIRSINDADSVKLAMEREKKETEKRFTKSGRVKKAYRKSAYDHQLERMESFYN